MKNIKLIFLLVFLTVTGANAFAHDHNLATFTIYQVENTWLMKIDFTTSSIEQALLIEYGDDLQDFSERTYKEAVVSYFKAHITLQLDGDTKVDFGNGGIKLGDHSSQLILGLANFYPEWSSLACAINCFEENDEQSNLVRVELGDGVIHKSFLRSKNGFETKFEQTLIRIVEGEG